ncbi:putative tail fiber [Klebsiella phage KMI8]|nr:putative tail fiber [Klebsiella phage KMI8]
MATYKVGKVKINGNGLMTGTGTNWTAANALVRVGATVVLSTNPVRIYTVGSIISATSIQLSDWGSDAAITTDTNYSILLHDGLTVQGLAQDTAETLRYYRNFEQTLGDASKLNVGEAPGNLMKVGAFGLGGKGKTIPQKATGNELMKSLRDIGCTWWRAPALSNPADSVQIYGHGSGFFSYCGDTMAAINVDYSTGKMIVLSSNEGAINGGNEPKKVNVFSTAQLPDINNDTTGRLAISSGGTGANSADGALKNLGVKSYIPVLSTPTINDADTWLEIGSIIDSGQGGGYVQFLVGGVVGYGSSRMDSMIVTFSARTISTAWNNGNLRTVVTIKRITGASQTQLPGVEVGLTQVNSNTYRVYLKVPRYTGEIKLTQIASTGWDNRQFFRGWFALETDSIANQLKAEPAGIKYVSPDVIYDDWNSVTRDFAAKSLAANNNGDANVYINRARLRSTSNNGNLVIGTDSGDAPEGTTEATPASVYIRQAGHLNSKVQTQFLPNGNVQSTGHFQGASDVRLKTNFKPIKNPLDSMMKFRGATFKMINGGSDAVGIIAQDINEECPQAIQRFETEVNGEVIKDAMAVNSSGFAAAYSVEAMKEVVKLMDLMLEDPEAASARIKALKAMINDELPE